MLAESITKYSNTLQRAYSKIKKKAVSVIIMISWQCFSRCTGGMLYKATAFYAGLTSKNPQSSKPTKSIMKL